MSAPGERSAGVHLTAAFALVVFPYGVVSQRLNGTVVTAAMLLTAAACAALLLFARPGLVTTLFNDASRTRPHPRRAAFIDGHFEARLQPITGGTGSRRPDRTASKRRYRFTWE